MLFNSLSSELIKSQLVAKLAYSVGYKAINAAIQAKKPLQLECIDGCFTGEFDRSPLVKAQMAKRAWAVLVEFANTHYYTIDPISSIADTYIKGSGKPIQKASTDIINLRASVSGTSITGLHKQEDKQREVLIAKKTEEVQGIITEFSDIAEYANSWYEERSDGLDGIGAVDLEDILTDDFVIENYPKIVKTQCNFWSKYNNWDDAELIMIASDQELLK